MRHASGIPALTKSRFGTNQSYEVLTPDRRYVKTDGQENIHNFALKIWLILYNGISPEETLFSSCFAGFFLGQDHTT